MEKSYIVLSLVFYVLLLFPIILFRGLMVNADRSYGSDDGSERWGYVTVRPGAQMFWWLYKSPNRIKDSINPWPIILWLQGGPGSSGVGVGNFQEIGPLDTNSTFRESTWLKKSDLLFVDSPVGTGFSYVENENTSLLVKTDEEATEDLMTLLIKVFNKTRSLQNRPLYIVGESYGGKIAVTLGLAALNASDQGQLKASLGGVVLGNSWISPEDYVLSWGPLLNDVSRLDNNGLDMSNRLANQIKEEIKNGEFVNATATFFELGDGISNNSNGVNFYNFLTDYWMDILSSSSSDPSINLTTFMNDEVRKKLKIIPNNLTWVPYSELVFNVSEADFMKPRIDEVDVLLSRGVNVTIYSGQLDVICSTKGTEAWVQKLQWKWLDPFLNLPRIPINYIDPVTTRGFKKSYRNLHFYWILDAGHFVPVERPFVSMSMIGNIIQSPAS